MNYLTRFNSEHLTRLKEPDAQKKNWKKLIMLSIEEKHVLVSHPRRKWVYTKGHSTERRNEGESINLIRAHFAPAHKSVILS